MKTYHHAQIENYIVHFLQIAPVYRPLEDWPFARTCPCKKVSIALAYRLTLNSLMRKETDSMKSNLLILDEPTDGFSKNQLGKIREVLDELKSEQIILVSHEKELETYVDNIFQISKQDGISKIIRMN